jgi:hypothetical protein
MTMMTMMTVMTLADQYLQIEKTFQHSTESVVGFGLIDLPIMKRKWGTGHMTALCTRTNKL